MRRIRWYTGIGIVILFLIATAGFIKIFNSINNMAHYDNMNVKVESEEVNHQIQLDIETKEAGDLTSVKSITITKGQNIEQKNKNAKKNNMKVKVESKEVNHQIQKDNETKEAGDLTSVKSIPFTQVKNIDQTIKKWANEREQSFFTEMKESDLLLDYKTSAHF